MTLVVVVVVVDWGGGISFIHGLSREPMYGLKNSTVEPQYFCHF